MHTRATSPPSFLPSRQPPHPPVLLHPPPLPLSPGPACTGSKAPFNQFFTLNDIYNKHEEFDKTALRCVRLLQSYTCVKPWCNIIPLTPRPPR